MCNTFLSNLCFASCPQCATLRKKGVPPQDPYFLKNGQINRVTKFSSTSRPTESDSKKKGPIIGHLFISMQFQIQFPRLESRVVTIFVSESDSVGLEVLENLVTRLI